MRISRYLVLALALFSAAACTTARTTQQALPDNSQHVNVWETRETVFSPTFSAVAQYHCDPVCRPTNTQIGFARSPGDVLAGAASNLGASALLGLSFPNPGNSYISAGNGSTTTTVGGASASGGNAAGGTGGGATAAGGQGGMSNSAATGGQGGRGGLAASIATGGQGGQGGQGGRGGYAVQQQGQGQEQTSGRPHLTYR